MKEDHEPGVCHCCLKETEVRWKNIYHIGSEGLWVCMYCEMKIVEFVRELRSDKVSEKLKKLKNLIKES